MSSNPLHPSPKQGTRRKTLGLEAQGFTARFDKNGWAHFCAESEVRRIKYEMACRRRDLQGLEHKLRDAMAEERRLRTLISRWMDVDVMPEPGTEPEDEDKDTDDDEW